MMKVFIPFSSGTWSAERFLSPARNNVIETPWLLRIITANVSKQNN